jgi:hypothetical protein
MGLTSIIYHSSAVKRFSEEELMELLQQSRVNNLRLGVTGLLLYKDLDFMQVIEGEENKVRNLSYKIEKDPRHRAYTELRWEIIRERRFPEWSMGFKSLKEIDAGQIPGYSAFLDEPLSSHRFQTDPSRAEKLLLLFRDGPQQKHERP